MTALFAHGPRRKGELDITRQEHRGRRTGPKRFETAQLGQDIRRAETQVDFQVEMAGLSLAHGLELSAHGGIEGAGKGFCFAGLHRDASRHGVSTVLDEVGLAFPDEGVDVQSRGGAGASNKHAIVVADDHAGSVAVLDEPRGDDANDPAVPILTPDDVDVLVVGPVRELLDGRFGDFGVVGSAHVIEPVEVEGELIGPGFVPGGEQVHRLGGAGHAPGGIDAGADARNDVAHRQVIRGAPHDLEQGADAGPRIAGDTPKAMVKENAVLTGDLDQVGSDAQGHQVEAVVGAHRGQPEPFGQGLGQLERHATAAELLEGIGATRLLGVEDGVGLRHDRSWQVVVTDDDIDAQGFGFGHAFYGPNATIEGDDDAATGFGSCLHAGLGQAIALGIAIRDVGQDVKSVVGEEFMDEGHRCGAVHIVIPIRHDALALALGLDQTVHGLFHPEQVVRVVEVVQIWREKGVGMPGGNAPQFEQTCNQARPVGVAQLLPASFAGGPIGWRNVRLTGHGQ